ncbi:MAG: 50S ribosomal protein L10 [Chloroherpetonaceae bacterium]
MKREQKEKVIASVAEKLKKAQGVYLTDFTGLTVEEISNLRNEFRKAGIEYRVVKNTLIKKAMQEAKVSDKIFSALKNSTGLAFSYEDPIAPAKIIKKFASENEKLKFKAATIDGVVFESKQLNEVAGMLTKAENIARAIGTVNTLVAGVPCTIHAVMRNLVNVLDQIAKQKASQA